MSVMTKPVQLLSRAAKDLTEVVDYYVEQAGQSVARRLMLEIQAASRHIARAPASGSPRYGLLLQMRGLRFWRLKRYPHLLFYVETGDRVSLLRILHGRRDLPQRLASARD